MLAALSVGGMAFLSQILLDVAAQVHELRAVATAERIAPLDQSGERPAILGDRPSSYEFDDVLADLVSKAMSIDSRTPSLLRVLGREELRAASKLLHEFGRQDDVSYDGEDRHWLLRLTHHTGHSIQATSKTTVDAGGRGFGDGGLWLSELGQRYLQAQAKAVSRGVAIQRVFIMDRPELLKDETFIEIYRQQKRCGIQVRVIDPSELPGGPQNSPDDFILFDNEINYETIPADNPLPSGHPVIVKTTLISDTDRLAERAQYFDQLWAAAR
ncbi:MAG: DUF6879 family protein [Micromonosporaceae bacterium]